jgi:hypothetical protein
MRRPQRQTSLFPLRSCLKNAGRTVKRRRRGGIKPRVKRARRAEPWEARKSSRRRREFLQPFAKTVTEPKAFGASASLIILLAALACSGAWSAETLQTGSKAPYVHRINLYDQDGVAIGPADSPAMPYSPKSTCAKCHDYAAISNGWHFNADDPDVPAGRPGEPWIFIDEETGTQIPLSYRGWPGTYRPEALGLSPWDFIQIFGRHMPGSGVGEKGIDDSTDPHARWDVSGAMEIDCLSCHSGDPGYDQTIRAAQVEDENFRWIPVAASGLAIVRGGAKNASDFYDPTMPPNPDFPEQSGPQTAYNEVLFDANDRVFMDIPNAPESERCYFCHTTRATDADEFPKQTDVHLAAGMACADCHTNELDHSTIRGYEGEAFDYSKPHLEKYTCAGCHSGQGEFAAPIPKHKGLPPIHFEKMTCTTCHSGPTSSGRAVTVQTSMSHGLGLAIEGRDKKAAPTIRSPIFVRQDNGKFAPHNMIQPTFWAWKDGLEVSPIPLETLSAVLKTPLPVELGPEIGAPEIYSTVQNLEHLEKINTDLTYFAGGAYYAITFGGGHDKGGYHPSARYAWPIAHDVRPALQSLGSNGCDDCHSDKGPLFQGLNEDAWRALNASFKYRLALKVFGFAVAALLAMIIALYAFKGLSRTLVILGRR